MTVLLLVSIFSTVPGAAAERVHIAVLGLFHSSRFVLEVSPSSPISVASGQKQFAAGIDAHQSITISRSGREIIVRLGNMRAVSDRFTFTARQGGEAEFLLSVPGKLRRRYRGNLTITVRGGELVAVVDMELETAVASVVAAELPGDAPLEAMKAQAVVSRSYFVSGHHHAYADFCDTTHCQFLREPPAATSHAVLATNMTKGQVLTWKGKPFAAMYSASCSGRTHSLAEIGSSALDYPYFSVECAYCRHSPQRWSSQISQSDANALSADSEQERIKAARRLGWNAVPSSTFTKSDTQGTVTLDGVGHGHGVGLCQHGASGMARDGKDFRAILAWYFPNTAIETVAKSQH